MWVCLCLVDDRLHCSLNCRSELPTYVEVIIITFSIRLIEFLTEV